MPDGLLLLIIGGGLLFLGGAHEGFSRRESSFAVMCILVGIMLFGFGFTSFSGHSSLTDLFLYHLKEYGITIAIWHLLWHLGKFMVSALTLSIVGLIVGSFIRKRFYKAWWQE
jgi:hypothetical protein